MSAEKKMRGYVPVRADIAEEAEKLLGFVALIDVLGFRELVGRSENLASVQGYVDAVAARLRNDRYSQLQFVLFSDNLVINTRDEKEPSLVALICACSDVLFTLAQKDIAVRGAIAHGQFMRSLNTQQGVIVAGRPIVEADFYQHSQNWVGVMLAPSVVRIERDIAQRTVIVSPNPGESSLEWSERAALPIHLQHWEKIPFHSQNPGDETLFDGYAVVPIRPEATTASEIKSSLNDTLRDLSRMKAGAPNPPSQGKYSRTFDWLESLATRWSHEARSTTWLQL